MFSHPSKQHLFSYRLLLCFLCLLLATQFVAQPFGHDWLMSAARQPGLVDFFLWLWVHSSWLHLAVNLAGLVLLFAIRPKSFCGYGWLARMLVCGWLGNMLFAFIHGLEIDGISYIALGLSGSLHAMAWMIGCDCLKHIQGKLLLAALVGKILYEQFLGAVPFSQDVGLKVLVDVHLYAVIAAVWVRTIWHALGKVPQQRSR